MTDEQSEPRKQGEAAYLAGAKSASNPWGHMHTSWAAAQWDYGFQAARDRAAELLTKRQKVKP
jgi:hypothetical protein